MNNRQAGRRRGRGGQRSPNSPNRGADGNRIDNRARGNAAQLLEKYKNLARDAQMQGDRVNSEYYLQFADHYFRVLNENRARFEENNRRQRDDSDEDEEYEAEGDGRRQDEQRADEDRGDRNERGNRGDRNERGDRAERGERRNGRANGHANGAEQREGQSDESERNEAAAEEAPKRRRGRPKRDAAEAEAPAGIDADRLPPSLSAEDGEEAPKPRRRRTAKPKAESDGENVTSAA